VTPKLENRIGGLRGFRGPLGTNGAYTQGLTVSLCSGSGEVDFTVQVAEYAGAAHQENVVRRSLWRRFLAAIGGVR